MGQGVAVSCNHCRGNCACPPTVAERYLDVNERRGCVGGTCTCLPQTGVRCETCGQPTRLASATRCDGCWEVESRLHSYLVHGGTKALAFVELTLRTVRRVALPAREAKALTVACPVCHANIGSPCEARIAPNDIVSPHILRLEAAEKASR